MTGRGKKKAPGKKEAQEKSGVRTKRVSNTQGKSVSQIKREESLRLLSQQKPELRYLFDLPPIISLARTRALIGETTRIGPVSVYMLDALLQHSFVSMFQAMVNALPVSLGQKLANTGAFTVNRRHLDKFYDIDRSMAAPSQFQPLIHQKKLRQLLIVQLQTALESIGLKSDMQIRFRKDALEMLTSNAAHRLRQHILKLKSLAEADGRKTIKPYDVLFLLHSIQDLAPSENLVADKIPSKTCSSLNAASNKLAKSANIPKKTRKKKN